MTHSTSRRTHHAWNAHLLPSTLATSICCLLGGPHCPTLIEIASVSSYHTDRLAQFEWYRDSNINGRIPLDWPVLQGKMTRCCTCRAVVNRPYTTRMDRRLVVVMSQFMKMKVRHIPNREVCIWWSNTFSAITIKISKSVCMKYVYSQVIWRWMATVLLALKTDMDQYFQRLFCA